MSFCGEIFSSDFLLGLQSFLGWVFNPSVSVHPLQSGRLLRVLGDLFFCRAVFSSVLPHPLDNSVHLLLCLVPESQRPGVREDPVLSRSFSTLIPSTVCTVCSVLLKMLMIQYWARMRWLDGVINLNGREFEQALGDGEGQGSLTCCSP